MEQFRINMPSKLITPLSFKQRHKCCLFFITYSGGKCKSQCFLCSLSITELCQHWIPSITAFCLTRATQILISHQFSRNSSIVKNKLDILNILSKSLPPSSLQPTSSSLRMCQKHPHKKCFKMSHKLPANDFLFRKNNRVPSLPLIRALFHPFFVYPCCLAAALLESLLIAVWQWVGWLSSPEGVVRGAVCGCISYECIRIYSILCQHCALDLTCDQVTRCVCRYVCVGCGSVCVSSKGDVAWRSLLSDPMSRPMLWCEGHCQETTTRQHRYSCPQCSFSSVAHTHTHTLMGTRSQKHPCSL